MNSNNKLFDTFIICFNYISCLTAKNIIFIPGIHSTKYYMTILYGLYMIIYYSDIMIYTGIFIYTVDSDCMMSIDKMEFYIRACFSLHILFLQIIYYNRFNLLLFSFVANIQRTEQEAQTIATVVKSKSLEILENSFLKDFRGSTWGKTNISNLMVRST